MPACVPALSCVHFSSFDCTSCMVMQQAAHAGEFIVVHGRPVAGFVQVRALGTAMWALGPHITGAGQWHWPFVCSGAGQCTSSWPWSWPFFSSGGLCGPSHGKPMGLLL